MLPLSFPSSTHEAAKRGAFAYPLSTMRPLTVVKLGGSAITDKSRECTPNLPLIQRVAEEIARHKEPIILLHGGGSYAHPVVTRSGLQDGYRGPSQLQSISETELYLDQLTRIIGVSLLLSEKAFVPLGPMSFLTLRRGQIADWFLEPIKKALDLGLIPLIHGDLAFDSSRGCGVISADRLASFLGVSLRASRVLFGCDVDGVYLKNPKVSPNAKLVEEVNRKNARSILTLLANSPSADATGGMLSKVREAIRVARSGRECCIFNLKREMALGDALRGKVPTGTRFPPWRRGR